MCEFCGKDFKGYGERCPSCRSRKSGFVVQQTCHVCEEADIESGVTCTACDELLKDTKQIVPLLRRRGNVLRPALAALVVIAEKDLESRTGILQEGAVPLLLKLLVKSSDAAVKDEAALTLVLVTADSVQSCKTLAAAGSVEDFLLLLRSGEVASIDVGTRGLLGAATNPANRNLISVGGGVRLLVDQLDTGTTVGEAASAAALDLLIQDDKNLRESAVDAGILLPLFRLVRTGRGEARRAAAQSICTLLADSKETRRVFAEMVSMEDMLKCLRSKERAIQEFGARGLQANAMDSEGAKAIVEKHGEELLVELLRSGGEGVQMAAAGALNNLAVDESLCETIAKEAVEPLFALLQLGSDQAKLVAAHALTTLTFHRKPREDLAACVNVDVLLSLLNDRVGLVRTVAARGLHGHAMHEQGMAAILATHALPELVRVVNDRAFIDNAGAAAWTLAALTRERHVCKDAVDAEAVPPALLLLKMGDHKHERAAYASASLIGNLAKVEELRAAILEHDPLTPLVALLQEGSEPCQQAAARALHYLSKSSKEVMQSLRERGAMQALANKLEKKAGTDLTIASVFS